jgi:predicted GIY-YIG superfamily endonuclease
VGCFVVGRPAYIYLLSDPRTNEVRYVGKTCDPKRRFWDHIGNRDKTHNAKWVRALLKDGVRPVLEVIEEFDDHDERFEIAERFWISSLRFLGVNLTNQESGGMSGKTHSLASRMAISAKAKGRPFSALAKERARISHQTPEFKALQAKIKTGVPRSKEVMDRLHAAARGQKRTEEQKARMRAARKLHPPMSEETRRKISETLKARAAKRGVDIPV